MKVTLIQCPVWGTYDPPMALAQLSACLREEKHEVFIFDLNIKLYLNRKENYKNMWAWEQSLFWYDAGQIEKFSRDNNDDIEGYVKEIINTGARIIGFSVSAASRLFSIELAKRLKKTDKKLTVVFGGPLFFEKDFINSIIKEEVVDIVVPREGEIIFTEIVRLIEKEQDISSCRGIAFKENGQTINNTSRELLANLDNLPFLDFTDLPLNEYDDSEHIPFMASRGCIQRCAFCSSRMFWSGFRTMSGERIFKEIAFHKRQQAKLNRNLGHVDFLDLLFNGNMKSLVVYCDLMRKAGLDIYWSANMIIRPELTYEVIKKMKDAGCEHIIFGIESGSQRILSSMSKYYQIKDADRIVRQMHELGIIVTCNFMFGFPGEAEEDFEMTLDFIKRNAKFLDRVYPSRTYCALEEYSYFHAHLEEFGIKPHPPNHLYWESIDGKNTYPVRLQRCEEFCNLASSLGIEVGCGVQTSIELDKLYNLAFYYECKKDYHNAINCFLNYNKLDSANEVVSNKINSYYQEFVQKRNPEVGLSEDLSAGLRKTVANTKKEITEMLTNPITKVNKEDNLSLLKQQQRDNSQLNNKEFESQEIILESSPKAFFLQAAGPCNSYCVFCSRGTNYDVFNLATHRAYFEEKLNRLLMRAEQIILTGSGEFLLLPSAEELLDYFNHNFPQTEKMFSTNASTLTPKICDKIVNSKNKYTIHASLHSSNNNLHKTLTRTGSFHKIIGQLNYLLKLRKNTSNLTVHLIFVATTLNIADLPNFVRLAANLGVDKVICYYNYIYVPAQKYLSCFFNQELTNKMLDEAEKIASRLNINIDLPSRFGLKDYPVLGICREAWSQIMLNAQGHIIPCDASEDANESLENKDFWDVWNGSYYQNLRKNLIEGNCSCFKHCFRANPAAVNDFRSHVIHRGRKESEINIFWGDNF